MTISKIGTQALTAFCASSPTPEAVTAFLQSLGLHLDLHLETVHYAAYKQLPDLPTQYHYQTQGLEVMYLAGEDTPLDGECFPGHASRFWIYPGPDGATFGRVIAALSAHWLLTWQLLDQHTSLVSQPVEKSS